MNKQRRECILTVNTLAKTTTLSLMDGEKVVLEVEIPYVEHNPTYEPTYSDPYNQAVRANQEQGLDAQGNKIYD